MNLKRNEPCHCGSGKKYKACCMRADITPEPYVPPKGSKMGARTFLTLAAGMGIPLPGTKTKRELPPLHTGERAKNVNRLNPKRKASP